MLHSFRLYKKLKIIHRDIRDANGIRKKKVDPYTESNIQKGDSTYLVTVEI